MTLGQKIKSARIKLQMTQEELAGDKITRNMLSSIERDKASPSLDTLRHLAISLDLPLPYLLSEDNDLFYYKKKERMPAIKHALETKNYNACVSLITYFDTLDDELNYILSLCFFELGIQGAKNGSLDTASKNLRLCLEYSTRTLYDTSRFIAIAPLYLAIADNVNAPLLEFDEDKYLANLSHTFEYEFYKYLTLDFAFDYTNTQFGQHIEAKSLIKERKYSDALEILISLDEQRQNYEYNAYFIYSVYADMEICFKQLYDFESAYKYSSKRLSLIEGFSI